MDFPRWLPKHFSRGELTMAKFNFTNSKLRKKNFLLTSLQQNVKFHNPGQSLDSCTPFRRPCLSLIIIEELLFWPRLFNLLLTSVSARAVSRKIPG